MGKLEPVGRALGLLDAIVADGGRASLAALARRNGIPAATAHRHANALVEAGYLKPSAYGRHVAGPALRRLAAGIDDKQIAANAAAPILDRLAARLKCVVQFGTFEDDMVTYRVKAGRDAGVLFTRVGMQLEAYCSGMGKVLLAHLPEFEREAYLAGGPFVALTGRTITDAVVLRGELETVQTQRFAIDNEEVVEGLRCIAVPLFGPAGEVIAALSVSQAVPQRHQDEKLLPLLKVAAVQIERTAFGTPTAQTGP